MIHAALQAAVLEKCRRRGLLTYYRPRSRGSRGTAKGFPDLVVVGPGGHLFAELKSEGEETTAEQDWWAFVLIESGATWFLWDPSDLLDGTIDRELDKLATRESQSTP